MAKTLPRIKKELSKKIFISIPIPKNINPFFDINSSFSTSHRTKKHKGKKI